MGAGQSPLRQPSIEEADSRNEVFDVLKNARWRAVLRYLLYEEPEADFRELVDYVAGRENETKPDGLSPAERNRVRTALYQHHLDKLSDAGFIDYEKREGVVRRNGRTDEVIDFIDPRAREKPETILYAFGVAVLGIGLLIAAIPIQSAFAGVLVGILGLAMVLYQYRSAG